MGSTARVYVDTVRWFIRPNNTDWLYNFNVAGLPAFEPGLSTYVPASAAFCVRYNAAFLARRLGLAQHAAGAGQYLGRLDAEELARSGCNVVFSHRAFPENCGNVPVLWQHSVLDPVMQMANGHSASKIEREYAEVEGAFSRATAVQVSTEAERRRLGARYPRLAERFRYIPFFLPRLGQVPFDQVRAKQAAPEQMLLFVGREAKRKGLDLVLAGLEKLDFGRLRGARLVVISDLTGPPVSVPAWPNVRHLKRASNAEVLGYMKQATAVLMPSRAESYGLVYLEAMSQGAIPVVPDWEVQREIVDQGGAGCITTLEPDAIATIVEQLLSRPERRIALAESALRRFMAEYAPAKVAARYAAAFDHCIKQRRLPA